MAFESWRVKFEPWRVEVEPWRVEVEGFGVGLEGFGVAASGATWSPWGRVLWWRAGLACLGAVFFLLVVHPLFHPLPGLTHFLCLAKESKQRKARPRWRKTPSIFVTGRRRGKLAALKQFPAFFPPAYEN